MAVARRIIKALAILTLLAAAGCSSRSAGAPTADDDAPAAFKNLHARYDLLAGVHLADVVHEGLVMDFGTPARQKYTMGGWKSGWEGDSDINGVSFTYATSAVSRVFFQWDEDAAPATIVFRMRRHAAKGVSVYLNDQPIQGIRMEEDGWKEHTLAVPAEKIHRGENRMLLRWNGMAEGEERAAAVDYIRIVPGTAVAGSSPILYSDLVADLRVGSEEVSALAVRAPTRLSYYLEVPPRAKLGFRVGLEGASGTVAAKVTITEEGGAPRDVWSASVRAGRNAAWQDVLVDLSGLAGKVVRLDLVTAGNDPAEARFGWASPAVLVPRATARASTKRAKNVIVLLEDTTRADALQPWVPGSRVRTPALSRFATESALFEHAIAQESWTKPSVATVLSGLYPETHQAKTFDSRVPQSVQLISEVFNVAGFKTAAIIANGYVSDKFGFNQGWDLYRNLIRDNQPTQAERTFGDALGWIEQNKDQPFFIYIQTIDPHVPYDPPDEFLRLYDPQPYAGVIDPRRTADQLGDFKRHALNFEPRDREHLRALYDGEITYHDKWFGHFLDRLRQLGVLDDTVIVYTADHGEEFFDHGSVGHGHTLYQELIHVPLMVRFPGAVRGGLRVREPVELVDIVPTVLEMAGREPLPEAEGRSLVPYLHGATQDGPPVSFSEFLEDRRSVTSNGWKLVFKGAGSTLFDLRNDPRETRDACDTAPIALRYARIMLGQFIGAPQKSRWWIPAAETQAAHREQERVEVDDTTREQLRALGYAQ